MIEPIRFLSVCSGIEAASVAWEPLGWCAVAVSEIDPFPCHVLHHRQGAGRPLHMPSPDAPGLSLKEARARANAIKAMATIPEEGRIPNFGDMTAFREWPDAATDLLVGGTPCQSFSVAGLRKGMDDPRGNLALVYLAIAARYRPGWLVWENVPGVLSSNRGRDFGSFLGALAQLGYGFAWRVLDAQYVRTRGLPFAVPQRRRRVFLVGYLGDWRPAAAVLFDGQSLRGDPPPRREAGKRPAPTLAARTRGGGGFGTDFDLDGGLIAGSAPISMAHGQGGAEIGFNNGPTLTCNHEAPIVAHALRAEGFDASEDGTGRGTPIVPVAFDSKASQPQALEDGTAPTLRAMGHAGSHANAGGQFAVAFDAQAGGNTGLAVGEDVSGTLHGGGKHGGRAAVAFAQNSRDEVRLVGGDGGISGALAAEPGMKQTTYVAFQPGNLARGAGASPNPEVAPTIKADHGRGLSDQFPHVAFDLRGREGGAMPEGPHETASIRAAPGGSSRSYVASRWAVRRLTPLECERLQGFPDGYTDVPYRGRNATPDGPRYKALGNSMACNAMEWIGERIELVRRELGGNWNAVPLSSGENPICRTFAVSADLPTLPTQHSANRTRTGRSRQSPKL